MKETITVQGVSQKDGRYSITDGTKEQPGKWYSDFGKCPCEKGDRIAIEYVDVPGKGEIVFHNIKEIKVLFSANNETLEAPVPVEKVVQKTQCTTLTGISLDEFQGIYNEMENPISSNLFPKGDKYDAVIWFK